EVVVDAEDAVLVENRLDVRVQLARRFLVPAERLLDHHPGPAVTVSEVEPGLAQADCDRGEQTGRGGEVERTVALCAAGAVALPEHLRQGRVGGGVVVAATHITGGPDQL